MTWFIEKYIAHILVLIFVIPITILFIQSLIDRSLRHFKEIEYELKIQELEKRLEKLEKLNENN